MCVCAVRGEVKSRPAISLFGRPSLTSRTTSSSVGVSDPAVYRDPDRFDITREDAPAMLTFGGGIHYCLGTHLARIELADALTNMARRMPHMRTTGSVPWKSITGISGPASLPVEFTTHP
jgi:cytochrome P450